MNALNLKYCALQAVYFLIYCAVFAYETVFLLGSGFGTDAIGIFSAVSGTLSAVLQPAAARLVDSGRKFTLQRLLLLLCLLCAGAAGLLLLLPQNKRIVGIAYIVLMMLLNLMMPLLFSISFYYANRKQPVNFGIARGTGAIAYGIGSMILGRLIPVFGIQAAPAAALFLLGLTVLLLFAFPMRPEESKEAKKSASAASDGSFFHTYFWFLVTVGGIILVYVAHWLFNTYLFQIVTHHGGNEADLGTAIAVGAVMELCAMFCFSALAKRVAVERLLLFSALCYFLRCIAYVLTGGMTALFAIQLLQGVTFGLLAPASVYYSDRIMAPAHKVTGQSLMTMALTIGGVIGNLLGGRILSVSTVPAMLLTGAGFAAAGFAVLTVSLKKQRQGLSF